MQPLLDHLLKVEPADADASGSLVIRGVLNGNPLEAQRRQHVLCQSVSTEAGAAEELDRMFDQPGPAAEDAELVVSELVGNCVRTEAHNFDLVLEGHHETLRVEATDDAPGQPRPRPSSPTAENGRGLLIVDTLATDWGVRNEATDKTVWADLPIAADCAPNFACAHSG